MKTPIYGGARPFVPPLQPSDLTATRQAAPDLPKVQLRDGSIILVSERRRTADGASNLARSVVGRTLRSLHLEACHPISCGRQPFWWPSLWRRCSAVDVDAPALSSTSVVHHKKRSELFFYSQRTIEHGLYVACSSVARSVVEGPAIKCLSAPFRKHAMHGSYRRFGSYFRPVTACMYVCQHHRGSGRQDEMSRRYSRWATPSGTWSSPDRVSSV